MKLSTKFLKISPHKKIQGVGIKEGIKKGPEGPFLLESYFIADSRKQRSIEGNHKGRNSQV